MITSAQVRQMVQDAVEAQPVFNTFYSIRNTAKDRPSTPTYPCAMYQYLGTSLDEDGNGIVTAVQRCQLLVLDTVATDRTTDERDEALEAAEVAAINIALLLRDTYRDNATFANVRLVPLADEFSTLETGTILQFDVRGLEGACLGDNPPGVLPTPTPLGLRLDDLLDVDATDPDDGNAILFDAASGRWILGTAGSGPVTLDFDPSGSYLLATKDGTTNAIPMIAWPIV